MTTSPGGATREQSPSPAGRNWSGTYTYRAKRLVEPTSIAELQELVASSERIRGLGTRHSFNSLPDTAGTLVHLGALVGEPVLDREALTVTVDAATSYGVAAEFLQHHGYALHNTGSLPHISVAGAISTGTHGSGDHHRNLSSAAVALELVAADGDLRTVRRGDPGFDGMVVGLGAFGIITRVTLEIQPTFDIRQDAFVDLPWEKVLNDFDAVMSSAYSVSLMTRWSASSVDQLWLKTRVTDGLPAEVDADHLGATAAPVSLFAAESSSNMTPFGGLVGPWSERLYHFRLDSTPSLGDEIQSEYMVPRERIVEALTALRGIGDRIDGPLAVSEFRTMAGDDLWLSPAAGRDSVGVHFTWRNEPEAVDAVLPDIEAILLPLGARPHWGKHHHVRAVDIAALYPRLDEWAELVAQWDPTGKFGNPLIDGLLGGTRGEGRSPEMSVAQVVSSASGYEETSSPVPGLFADPNLFVWNGSWWLYATTDGIADWGSREFRAFSSPDLVTWTDHGVIHSLDNSGWAREHAWAPAHAVKNGKHYLYYTADGGNIGVAVAPGPAGPFTDLGRPLVAPGRFEGTAIDPSTFIDDDGTAYLFWGNGIAHGVELGDDMMSFDADDVFSTTPVDFREAAWVHRRGDVYFLSWSAGDTRSEDYRVLYATGPDPRGPWEYRGPILSKVPERGILATGHHSIARVPGTDAWVVAYHRFARPGGNGYRREVRFDVLEHTADHTIAPVHPRASLLSVPLVDRPGDGAA